MICQTCRVKINLSNGSKTQQSLENVLSLYYLDRFRTLRRSRALKKIRRTFFFTHKIEK